MVLRALSDAGGRSAAAGAACAGEGKGASASRASGMEFQPHLCVSEGLKLRMGSSARCLALEVGLRLESRTTEAC